MNSDLDDLSKALRDFATERDWEQFHNPKNLAMALAGEAGELVAEFQWLTPAEAADLSPEAHARVAAEMADVLSYLVRLADVLDIDLVSAASDKIAANATRYPVATARGNADKARDTDTQ
ncbi:NTP pyrophosphatase (non-canonical NTP hydrolase) [Stackebrandtia endophytica]|uniref:NTP pyrophosphatase (Non-canonical NTP hydrolase) n=1 Tax=Stackebrandtia endophytica TaxID=1496996 RepID=A0A543AR32_9ACTN|nr:nucleotide pyrophosphohydrolase [Stackebrandtia endophytica]TQL75029.1 NTP pyrophosphatase (non-canonical NTP hydrolase) [Stackebrandtia endophytica]